MKKLNFGKRILTTLTSLALVLIPQTALTADEQVNEDKADEPVEGSAAGKDAGNTAVGGVTAGTIAAIVAIAAAAAALRGADLPEE